MALESYSSRRRGEDRGYEDRGRGKAEYSSKGLSERGRESRDTWTSSYRSGSGGGAPPPAEKSMPLAAALKGLEEAAGCTDFTLRCVASVLESPGIERTDAEVALSKVNSWLGSTPDRQVLSQVAGSSVPAAVVRAIKKFKNEPLAAALCCVAIVRSSGSLEAAVAHLKVGALEEVGGLMDRHPHHGGVQNVCLLVLVSLLKDSVAARQAVTLGAVSRVLRAMEATAGREVQFNGLAVLRHLIGDGRAPRAGLQDAAMRAKVAHQNDNVVCTMANDVLALVTPRFKEVLCWHWQSGWCKLGPRCTYAHGPTDLPPERGSYAYGPTDLRALGGVAA